MRTFIVLHETYGRHDSDRTMKAYQAENEDALALQIMPDIMEEMNEWLEAGDNEGGFDGSPFDALKESGDNSEGEDVYNVYELVDGKLVMLYDYCKEQNAK